MKKIGYSQHLEFRLKFRKIPRALPKSIVETSKEFYFDTQTLKFIAIKKVRYQGKLREMAVSYEENRLEITLITIHPLKNSQKSNRINSGRWQLYEKR